MFKPILFLLALILSLVCIQYTGDTHKVIFVYGSEQAVSSMFLVLLMVALCHFIFYWVMKHIQGILSLSQKFRAYKFRKKQHDREFSRGQAIMYALSGDYLAASGHLNVDSSSPVLGDLILRATWLNQSDHVQEVDDTLGRIQALNAVPDGWMIWFRAYLMHQKGNCKLACDLLLDAIESGVHSPQIIQSFVKYVDSERHFESLLKHYGLFCRFVSQEKMISLLAKSASQILDQKVLEQAWAEVETTLKTLPKKVQSHPLILYYKVRCLLASAEEQKVLQLLPQALATDSRLIPILASAKIGQEQKVSIVQEALSQYPNNKDLIYLLSYLHAQGGAVDDTIKLLGNAITQD
ncbi:MAG: hypothetical protein VXW87_01570 [Pseudomonadota bacterium]|nr:hypothetical protein [Pseudomonadota bacterium]